jgi:hypothetical protein
LKSRTIMMPMRKPPSEVTEEERRAVHTWTVMEEVPETIVEAVRMMLQRERR